MFKDEATFLEEWILFHLAQGVSRFHLFDDSSQDDFSRVLEPFQRAGIVSVYPAVEGSTFLYRQNGSFNVGLNVARNDCKWLAFLDVDEFLFSPGGELIDYLPRNPLIAGVAIWWKVFGSSGHTSNPGGSVVRNYTLSYPFPHTLAETEETYLFQDNFFEGRRRITGRILQVKSIVRPKLVTRAGVHVPERYFGLLVDENGRRFRREKIAPLDPERPWTSRNNALLPTQNKLRINHYWGKSHADLRTKAGKFPQYKAEMEDYFAWDTVLNQEEDLVVQNRAP
jgi:hypothetical protein